MRTRFLSVLVAIAAGSSISAQEPAPARDTTRPPADSMRADPPVDSVRRTPMPPVSRDLEMALHRVRSLVNEGRAGDARKLMDSLSRNVDSASHAYASVLLTRAMVAPDISQAVRDLRRIAVDHALTPPAETALVRLAQIEMQRGDRASALRHLERLMVEFTTQGARARAAFWAARVHRESGEEPRACEALARARSWVPPGEIELSNQIDYAIRPCPPPPVAAAVSAPPTAVPAPVTATSTMPRPTTTAPATITTPATTTMAPPRDTSRQVVSAPAPSRPVVSPPTAATAATPAAPSATTGRFSVQVAAFNTLAEAQRFAGTFTQAGFAARVDGTKAPFRVRIGRYATQAEAAKVAEDFRRRGQAAFVAVVDPR